jgi:hypothetical protein
MFGQSALLMQFHFLVNRVYKTGTWLVVLTGFYFYGKRPSNYDGCPLQNGEYFFVTKNMISVTFTLDI